MRSTLPPTIAASGVDETFERVGLDGGVVVEQPDQLGATREREADPDVVSPGVPEVAAVLDDLDGGVVRCQLRARRYARAVVDDEHREWRVGLPRETLDAGECVVESVPVEYDGDDAHRAAIGT